MLGSTSRACATCLQPRCDLVRQSFRPMPENAGSELCLGWAGFDPRWELHAITPCSPHSGKQQGGRAEAAVLATRGFRANALEEPSRAAHTLPAGDRWGPQNQDSSTPRSGVSPPSPRAVRGAEGESGTPRGCHCCCPVLWRPVQSSSVHADSAVKGSSSTNTLEDSSHLHGFSRHLSLFTQLAEGRGALPPA